MTKNSSQKRNVSLVLSSGGARGIAHIGVIDELTKRGYKINSIAGASMGAFVGGLYATGNIEKFREWIVNLDKLNVFNLVDFTFSSQGFVRGERVFEKMRMLKMIPDVNIEDLPIRYVAIATDIMNNKEVVFSSGDLYKAIRASISIPNVFTPVEIDNGLLVDGGVLDPLPISKVARSNDDILVAVDLNSLVPYEKPILPRKKKEIETLHNQKIEKLIKKWDKLFPINRNHSIEKQPEKKTKLGYFDIMAHSVQLMQYKLSQKEIESNPPDVLVSISKYSCTVFEFYKGEEMIAYGREACAKALDNLGL